jgi:hypothetical protein
MDHSAAPIFDALVNYHAHSRYRFAPPDTVSAMRMREPAPRSARTRSTEHRAVDGFRYEEADLAVGCDWKSG